MATSSIFKNFVISGREEVENFVKMLDSEPMPIPETNADEISDTEEIKTLLRAGLERLNKSA